MNRPDPTALRRAAERRFTRRALVALALLALVGWLGFEIGHPLRPGKSRFARLASRAVRLPHHWWQGRVARADRHLTITLDSAAWRQLREAQDKAVRHGSLLQAAKKFVPARIAVAGEPAQTGKVRLKGGGRDHWSGKKWSLRIDLPRQARPVWGMRTFSVQAPETRNWLAEWLMYRLLRQEGLLALRYEFAQLTLNGQDKGIFAVEESFGPELIANNRRPPGILLKFDEQHLIEPGARTPEEASGEQAAIFRHAPIRPYDDKEVLTDSMRAPQFRRARALLAGIRDGSVPLARGLDAAAAGRVYAIIDLLGAHHAVRWKNARYYYDPTTDRLTLIAYDGNGSGRIRQAYPERWRDHRLYPNDLALWKDRFFTDSTFRRGYYDEALQLSGPSFLETFLRTAEPQLTAYRHLMYKDRPTYDYDWLLESLHLNRTTLRQYVIRQRR